MYNTKIDKNAVDLYPIFLVFKKQNKDIKNTPFDCPSLPPLNDETAPNSLVVTNAFTSICNVSDAKKKDVTQFDVQETANDARNKVL